MSFCDFSVFFNCFKISQPRAQADERFALTTDPKPKSASQLFSYNLANKLRDQTCAEEDTPGSELIQWSGVRVAGLINAGGMKRIQSERPVPLPGDSSDYCYVPDNELHPGHMYGPDGYLEPKRPR